MRALLPERTAVSHYANRTRLSAISHHLSTCLQILNTVDQRLSRKALWRTLFVHCLSVHSAPRRTTTAVASVSIRISNKMSARLQHRVAIVTGAGS